MKKALLKKVSKGKLKGQYRFVLKAANGETVAVSNPETYVAKHSAVETLQNNFQDFQIVDQTKEN